MANAGHIIIKNRETAGRSRVSVVRGNETAPVPAGYMQKVFSEKPENSAMDIARRTAHDERMRNGIDSQLSYEKSEADKTGQEFNQHERQKHWENVADRIDNKGLGK